TQKDGGAVAMFTTTRVVTSDANYFFTYYFWKNCVFEKLGSAQRWPTIGEIYTRLKNWPDQSVNDRKFSLFGDPAMVMNYPEYNVKIDSITQVGGGDTIKAL